MEDPNPIKGMIPILKELKKKSYKLGILTSNSEKNVKRFLGIHDIDFFDFIDSASLFGKQRHMRRLRWRYRIKKDDFYYFGDETRDVVASRKAGVKCISVIWGYNTKKILKEYNEHIAEKPKDILKLINKI